MLESLLVVLFTTIIITSDAHTQQPSVGPCCHWSTSTSCYGDFSNHWMCPESCLCTPPTWTPTSWSQGISRGDILVGAADAPGAALSNGYVGVVLPRHTPGSGGPPIGGVEHIAGVFDVKGNLPGGSNHAVILGSIPSWTATAYIAELDGITMPANASAMDLARGVYAVAAQSSRSGGECELIIYAHRVRSHLIIANLTCTAGPTSPLQAVLQHRNCTSPWIFSTLCHPTTIVRSDVECMTWQAQGSETPQTKTPIVGECHSYSPNGWTLSVPPGTTKSIVLISSRHSNMDPDWQNDTTQPPYQPAFVEVTNALENSSGLLQEHLDEMNRLFGVVGIEVVGNVSLARLVNASVYAVVSNYRVDNPYGGAPEGLLSTRYYGDSFWDVETWQWPTLLLFWPEQARATLEYRVRLAPAAEANAKNPMPYYGPNEQPHLDGMRFPWQSAIAGIEQAPGNAEDHIHGDIALAFIQYYRMTLNQTWLAAVGFPIIEGVARFYASRVTADARKHGTYHIERTMGPDEYNGNVTDSVYNNALAQLVLTEAYNLAPTAGRTPNSTFLQIANGLVILYDPVLDYHPEYKGFRIGNVTIKQADTVLLTYPLGFKMSPSTRRNDLKLYAAATDPFGPAMTWSIHSIVYRDIQDDEQAAAYFWKSYQQYSRPPFHQWHEGAGPQGSDELGAENLITGAGGFLQTVWAGYGGVRIESNGVLSIKRPKPLPQSTGLILRGFQFLSSRLDLVIHAGNWSIAFSTSDSLLGGSPLAAKLELVCSGKVYRMEPNKTLTFSSETEATLRAAM